MRLNYHYIKKGEITKDITYKWTLLYNFILPRLTKKIMVYSPMSTLSMPPAMKNTYIYLHNPMHAYTHTYENSHAYVHTPIKKLPCMRTHTPMKTQSHTYPQTLTYTILYIHTNVYTIHISVHTPIYKPIHTYIHQRTHKETYTHQSTHIYSGSPCDYTKQV